ncbi:MAG TPA: PIN domain-containing protein [Solirubrobacteraceae bacterium]|jgi:hypothetical protein|nr:PIN domain-containing protein [Solirubrobacteraceae bacterium]
MVLADSSAWIEFDRATGTSLERRMTELVGERHGLAVTEPVLMEVLAGARDARAEERLRTLLRSRDWLPFESTIDFELAARIFRRCAGIGLTPGGLLDCAIVAVALRSGATLLSGDAGQRRVAEAVGVQLEVG